LEGHFVGGRGDGGVWGALLEEEVVLELVDYLDEGVFKGVRWLGDGGFAELHHRAVV